MDKLFFTALLNKQPDMTEQKAEEILIKYVEDGGDINAVTKFLSEQLTSFFKSQSGKKTKTFQEVEI